MRAVRNLRKDKNIPDRQPIAVAICTPDEPTDRVIETHQDFLRQMALLDGLEHGVRVAKPPHCATSVVGTIELFVKLEGLIDIEDERRRLDKQKAGVERRIEAAEAALHNADFLAKAPDEVVAQKREAAEGLREQLAKIIQNLADLD